MKPSPGQWLGAAGIPEVRRRAYLLAGRPFQPGNLRAADIVPAGSGTRPGAGVRMAPISGRPTAERISGRLKGVGGPR
ncbi:hypothetical protein GCM10023083_56480 [Streptomyces phyllanthi]